MLGRRREQIIVVLGLLGVNIVLGWALTRFWKDYQDRTQWLLSGASVPPSGVPSEPGEGGTAPEFRLDCRSRCVQPPAGQQAPPAGRGGKDTAFAGSVRNDGLRGGQVRFDGAGRGQAARDQARDARGANRRL